MGDSGQIIIADVFCFTLSILVLSEKQCLLCRNHVQQVYMYFRGTGKAAEMRKEAARSTMMAAL